jgi:sugar O-acyltransferase (sialic acid O-acetyltransferase NeuD family)
LTAPATTFGIFGSGGCGRGIMPLLPDRARAVFVEDAPTVTIVNGQPVTALADFAAMPDPRIVVAVADPAARHAIARRCADAGLSFFEVCATDLWVMDDVSWGEGCLFSPRCTLTSNIRIGSHFHCNIASYVEHDCRIGDFVTFGPGVRCNGNVTIGDGAYIGSGAMIRQGITIGESATVGMGAVVVRDVAPNTVVAGNPARPLAGRLARASELPPRARR